MGWLLFRRSFRIIPGVRLNISKTGISTSVGTRGATVNIRGDSVRETIGVPGTGLSYSDEQPTSSGSLKLVILVVAVLAIAWLLR
jgi:hypothetical protein